MARVTGRIVGIVVAVVFLHACATPEPAPDPYLQRLATAGSIHFHADFNVFLVSSDGADAEREESGSSDMSRQLAQIFEAADVQAVNVVVGGADPARAADVVVGAAGILEGKSLGELQVLFVGDSGEAGKARVAIEGIGGAFHLSPH